MTAKVVLLKTEPSESLRDQVRREGQALLQWWCANAQDDTNGGFWGEIDAQDKPVIDAAKSVILNTRLLWFFSAMAAHLKSDPARQLADRASDYIRSHFIDPDRGGVYWRLDHKGRVLDSKKQGYAQAFAVYAFAEHYRVTQDIGSLQIARQLQHDIETRFWDDRHGGYIEALSAEWHTIDDQRLSEKDADSPKTMNTHLHILEAYTSLYRVAPDDAGRTALRRALNVFVERFANPVTGSLRLFYAMDWTDHTQSVSYGHDIEASWLMWEAVLALDDPDLVVRVRPLALALADSVLRDGMNADGGICYERPFGGPRDTAGEWWGQAEGLVGFVNAWQLSGEQRFLDAAIHLWDHVRTRFGAGSGNEWTWYATHAGHVPQYKAGAWKCPYHNGRAMIELDHRLKPAQL